MVEDGAKCESTLGLSLIGIFDAPEEVGLGLLTPNSLGTEQGVVGRDFDQRRTGSSRDRDSTTVVRIAKPGDASATVDVLIDGEGSRVPGLRLLSALLCHA
jgi:hypothetical protein